MRPSRPLNVAGDVGHVDLPGEQGIAVVNDGIAVDDDDRHGCVLAATELVGPSLVAAQVFGEQIAELVGIRDEVGGVHVAPTVASQRPRVRAMPSER